MPRAAANASSAATPPKPAPGRRPSATSSARDGGKTSASGVRAATPPWGTQSIHRAVTMLREIAAYGRGMRLVDISEAMGLERPTAHRILKGLVAQGMVMQDPATKAYRLGHVTYELGLAASPYFNLRELCQPVLVKMAERVEDSVYLVVRSGFDTVCLDLIEGSFPIRARTMEVGMRRPLGVGAGSIALILPLNEEETERIITVNEPRLQHFGRITAKQLRAVIARSRAAGYSINEENVLPGISAIGVPIITRSGPPYAAISVAGITARFGEQRREELARMLLREARMLAKRLEEEAVSWA